MYSIKIDNPKQFQRGLFYEMWVHFNSTNKELQKQLNKLEQTEIQRLAERGYKLILRAEKEGVKSIYYDSEALGIYIIMLLYDYDFEINGSKNMKIDKKRG